MWVERQVREDAIDALVAVQSMPRLVARLLAIRGVMPDDLLDYLSPDIAGLANPEELPGLSEAADVILRYLRVPRKIIVFGDYDCDGISATAILIKTLERIGADVSPFLPERLAEGYGMNVGSVTRLLTEYPDVKLIVTVDNGINAVNEIADLKAKGIEVVVTDHHLPGEELPKCVIVNPKVEALKPKRTFLEGLCGAGVAFMLANLLMTRVREENLYCGNSIGEPLLVLAGLATVTDVMPLRGQNRILVTEALKRFLRPNSDQPGDPLRGAPVGLKELYLRSSRKPALDVLTTKDFGFLIGPRINAAGRLTSGMEALNLVLEKDRERARLLAMAVDGHNEERRAIEQKMSDAALQQLRPNAAAQVIVFADSQAPSDEDADKPAGHSGVAGIVAARILEKLMQDSSHTLPVPVCVIVGSRGSARAPEGYNVRDAFVACEAVLSRFGGHAAAGGFSVKPGQMEAFRQGFSEACAKQADLARATGHEPCVQIDSWVELKDLTLDMAREIRKMEPFGEGNAEPVFGLKKVYFQEARPFGQEGKHLQVTVRSREKGLSLKGIWWGHGDQVECLRAHANEPFRIRFTLEISTYCEEHVEMRLLGFERADES